MFLTNLAKLADLRQSLAKLEAEAKKLEAEAIAQMVESNVKKISTDGYDFVLKERVQRKQFSQESEEVLELKAALEAETSELQDANKIELYKLQQTIRIAELRQRQLLTNVFIEEITSKLEAAKAAPQQTTTDITTYSLQLQRHTPEDSVSIESNWIGKKREEHEADCTDAKPLSFRQIRNWLIGTGLKLPEDEDAINNLWDLRRKQHIQQWQKKGKCLPPT